MNVTNLPNNGKLIYQAYGQQFQVTALEFSQQEANVRLEKTKGESVIAEFNGVIFIAEDKPFNSSKP